MICAKAVECGVALLPGETADMLAEKLQWATAQCTAALAHFGPGSADYKFAVNHQWLAKARWDYHLMTASYPLLPVGVLMRQLILCEWMNGAVEEAENEMLNVVAAERKKTGHAKDSTDIVVTAFRDAMDKVDLSASLRAQANRLSTDLELLSKRATASAATPLASSCSVAVTAKPP